MDILQILIYIISAVLTLFALAQWFNDYIRNAIAINKLPGYKGLPLIGNFHQLKGRSGRSLNS